MSGQAQHASCVVVGTRGILIRGASGSGKSALADTLIETSRTNGNYAALVADDRVFLSAEDDRVLARVPDAIRGKLEVRGFGLVETVFQPLARIHLVAELVPAGALERLPEQEISRAGLEGISLPMVNCPANNPGHSLRLIRWAFRVLFPGGADYI